MVRGDLTRGLALESEMSEVRGIRLCIAHARRAFAHLEPETHELAGGAMSFLGAGSPLSEAVGVGIVEPAGMPEVERIIAFYRERGSAARALCGPNTDLAFIAALDAHGFEAVESQHMLAVDLAAHPAKRDPSISECLDPAAWAHASASAFVDGKTSAPPLVEIGMLFATLPEALALEARDGDAIVATACMDVDGEMAGFFAGSTHPAHRGRGWQTALIRDRMARAREGGARYGRVAVEPGSGSERNFVRQGFVQLGKRTLWERRLP